MNTPADITGDGEGVERRPHFNWKVYGVLVAGGFVGALLLMPYVVALNPAALTRLSIPVPLALALSVLQTMVLVALVGGLGLWMATRVGLGAPRLEEWLSGDRAGALARLRPALLPAVIAGVVGAVVVLLLDVLVFQPQMAGALSGAAGSPNYWQGLLASFYGGIDEEILLRLGMMTFLVWLASWVSRRRPMSPSIYWTGNVLAALLFGAGHLPTAAALTTLTPVLIIRTVLLNGLLGIVYGYFYWKHGLVSGMVSHFSSDLILHVLTPLLVALGG